jgi:YfiH family protein
MRLIKPEWPAPKQVQSFVSTRSGGISIAPYDSLNLGDHVHDQINAVTTNRSLLRKYLPAEPLWLKQTHGTNVSTPQSRHTSELSTIVADAAVSNKSNEVLAILTADCLPVLFTSKTGSVVGAAHAGWRGLSAGILENTVREMLKLQPEIEPADLLVWFGPAIGPQSFEVGEDVLQSFLDSGGEMTASAFKPIATKPGKYLADLYQLARSRLKALGLKSIDGGQFCTVQDQAQFFSYRRDGVTGRFATLIWISE